MAEKVMVPNPELIYKIDSVSIRLMPRIMTCYTRKQRRRTHALVLIFVLNLPSGVPDVGDVATGAIRTFANVQ